MNGTKHKSTTRTTSKKNKPEPNAFDGERVWVPQTLHENLQRVRRTEANPDPAPELFEWYEAVDKDWSTGACVLDEPGLDMFKFWTARYAERWPAGPRRPQWATGSR